MKRNFTSRPALATYGLLVFFNSCTSAVLPPLQNQIVLESEMFINECACGKAENLADEQVSYTKSDPVSGWNTSLCHKSLINRYAAVIDLGAICEVSDVHFYDGEGEGKFEMWYGEPFKWTFLSEEPLYHYQKWISKKLNLKTRYIRIVSANGRFPVEILLEGKKNAIAGAASNKGNALKYPLMREFIGTNAFVDDPLGILSPFGSVREYHPWPDWNQPVKGELAFNPTSQGFNFDIYYKNLKRLRINCVPVLQQSPSWISHSQNKEAKPLYQANAEKLEAYQEHAAFLFQYAARYGKGKAVVEDLTLSHQQEKSVNLNLLEYYENWNEPDKWWKGKEAYFSPYEYAAMSVLDLEGFSKNNKVGIKNTDASAKLVMAGLANPNLDYIKALKFWCDYLNNGKFPWSAINIHHYSNDGGGQFNSKRGIGPEEDHLKEKLEKFTDYRNRYLPGVEVWISEFGYDIKDDSPQRASGIGKMSPEEVQGAWLLRCYLAAAAAGIDKAFQYMVRDTEGKGIYASSGLYYWKKTASGKEAVLRPVWYYLSAMQKILGDTRFEGELKSNDPDVVTYMFSSDSKSKQKVYAVWCKTSQDKTIHDYSLKLSGKASFITAINPADKHVTGITKKLMAENNNVKIDVSEIPVFIVAHSDPEIPFPKDDKRLILNSSMVSTSSKGLISSLVDEQDVSNNPDMGIFTFKPKTNWEVDYNQSFPVTAIIDLGKEYEVTKFYLNDGPGTGNVNIAIGKQGQWKNVSEDKMLGYQSWKAHVINKKTRYIQLIRQNAGAGIFEIAVYVKE